MLICKGGQLTRLICYNNIFCNTIACIQISHYDSVASSWLGRGDAGDGGGTGKGDGCTGSASDAGSGTHAKQGARNGKFVAAEKVLGLDNGADRCYSRRSSCNCNNAI